MTLRRAAKFRPAACCLALAATLTTAAGRCVAGEQIYLAENDQPAPMPPQRPSALAQPAQSNSAPSNDATSATPAAPQAPDEPIITGAFNAGPGTLLKLPPASHARMHQCAVEWQNMKTTGAAAEKTWFKFALGCLTR
jgi:hypothetical protein